MALTLSPTRTSFDATQYRGVRLWVKGNEQTYYVHIRTQQTLLPWQYYSSSFKVSAEWTKVDLSFDDFEPQSIREKVDLSGLSRIAIVAAKKAFQADVCVGRVEFYR